MIILKILFNTPFIPFYKFFNLKACLSRILICLKNYYLVFNLKKFNQSQIRPHNINDHKISNKFNICIEIHKTSYKIKLKSLKSNKME